TGSVTDLASNPLADFSSTFTTAPNVDTSRPSIVGQRPGNGANGVAANVPLVMFVNEPLDAASVPGAVQVTQNGSLVTGTVTLQGGAQVIRFVPTPPWAFNALIQVFVDGSAPDPAGNGLNGYSASFRTSTDPATTPPVPVAISPNYGYNNAPLNV